MGSELQFRAARSENFLKTRVYLDPGCPTFFWDISHKFVGQSPKKKDIQGPGRVRGRLSRASACAEI